MELPPRAVYSWVDEQALSHTICPKPIRNMYKIIPHVEPLSLTIKRPAQFFPSIPLKSKCFSSHATSVIPGPVGMDGSRYWGVFAHFYI